MKTIQLESGLDFGAGQSNNEILRAADILDEEEATAAGGPSKSVVNIYRNRGVWAYALWIDGEYDHSDLLDASTEDEAKRAAAGLFPSAQIARVADTNE